MLGDLRKTLSLFLETLFEEAQGIELSRFQMDHVCFRTSSQNSYQNYKQEFLKIAELLGECEINGRPIATFSLHKPILWKDRVVRVIELPAPKSGKNYVDGFEHAEFVADVSFDSLKSKYAQYSLDTSGLDKSFNPELAISLKSCNIKFHHLPLAAVIQIENQKNLLHHLDAASSNFFNVFKKYHPLISGSVPLNISLPSSDIDIIFEVQDLKLLGQELANFFKEFSPAVTFKSLRSADSVIVRFKAFDFKFECVGQKKSVFQILAHQHLLIESRLLNICGESARSNIQVLKAQGIPTEVAFGMYFKMEGDPYVELFNMNQWSEGQLLQFVQKQLPYNLLNI